MAAPATAAAPVRPDAPATQRLATRKPAFINQGVSGERRAEALHRPRHGKAASAKGSKTTPWVTIGFMAVIHVLALVALLPQFWSLIAIGTMAVLYWVTACLGVTIGYHRLLSHRAFRVPRWLERFFATCGALSCQHGPIDWVGLHRHHHKFSDTEPDHHNSHRGFWWSHMGWMFEPIPAMAAVPRMTGDLAADPYYLWLNNNFLLLQIPLALLLFAPAASAELVLALATGVTVVNLQRRSGRLLAAVGWSVLLLSLGLLAGGLVLQLLDPALPLGLPLSPQQVQSLPAILLLLLGALLLA